MKFGSPANSSRVDDGVALASAAGVSGTGGMLTREADPSRDGGTAEGAPFGEVRWAGRRAATFIDKRASIRGQGSDPKNASTAHARSLRPMRDSRTGLNDNRTGRTFASRISSPHIRLCAKPTRVPARHGM